MHLIVELFESTNPQRNSEFVYCLHQNLLTGQFDRAHVFVEPGFETAFSFDKINFVECEQRPTFRQLFDFCNKFLDGDVCVVANNDIIFNNTLKLAQDLLARLPQTFIALSRWELVHGIGYELFDNAASQDCWIFRTPVCISDEMNFHLGQPGCDNRIARLVHDLGFMVCNPCKRIIARHFHFSQHRTHAGKPAVPGPYLLLPVTDDVEGNWDTIPVDGFDSGGNPIVVEEQVEK